MRSIYFPHYVTGAACEVIRQCCRLAPAQRPGLATLKHFIWFAGQVQSPPPNRYGQPQKLHSSKENSFGLRSQNFTEYRLF